MATNVVVLLRSEEGRRLVRAKCDAAGLDMEVLERLIGLELGQSGKLRKRGLWLAFDDIFGMSYAEDEN